MTGHADQCAQRYLEFAKVDHKFFKVTTPNVNDHQFALEDFEAKGALSPVASKMVLKVL